MGGLAINIMPKFTMLDLSITVEELSKSWMMIQSFNLKGQPVIGTICVKVVMVNLLTSSILHVIDAKTSYMLLLRQP